MYMENRRENLHMRVFSFCPLLFLPLSYVVVFPGPLFQSLLEGVENAPPEPFYRTCPLTSCSRCDRRPLASQRPARPCGKRALHWVNGDPASFCGWLSLVSGSSVYQCRELQRSCSWQSRTKLIKESSMCFRTCCVSRLAVFVPLDNKD